MSERRVQLLGGSPSQRSRFVQRLLLVITLMMQLD